MTYHIEINDVGMKFGNVEALGKVSATLPYGKIYGLLGRNGAGKTTILSMLGSFLEPSSGRITIGGKEVFENEAVTQHVTFVYQADYSEESEKVKGMLESSERYRPNFDRAYADELAKKFRLPMDTEMKKLSKGQQAAVNVVIGLANRTPITIFDEAYLGMDAPARELFYKELLEDHERHPRTMILSTHHVSEVDHLFEEVIILHEGSILMHEPIDKLLEQGVSVIGAARKVDQFTQDMHVLHEEKLGGTKQVMIYGELTDQLKQEAIKEGLEIGAISLQQLFIHLTEEGNLNGIR